MGFYQDFIASVEALGNPEASARLASIRSQLIGILPFALRYPRMPGVPDAINEEAGRELATFLQTAVLMKRARIVRLLGPQAEVFLTHPPVENQDYLRWLRLPYPELYIHLDPAITFGDYAGEYDGPPVVKTERGTVVRLEQGFSAEELKNPGVIGDLLFATKTLAAHHGDPMVKGVLLIECPGSEVRRLGFRPQAFFAAHGNVAVALAERDKCEFTEVVMEECERVLQVVFLLPLPDYLHNCHVATLAVMKDGRLLYSKHGLWQTRKRMIDWAIHLVNFLSSPSVKLVPTAPDAALQRARARRGKAPLPGWYEITYRKVIREYTRDKFSPKRWEHSFRYDVRGHFARFSRGAMAGRVLWIPRHQRGVKHDLYKPKAYRAGDRADAQAATTWNG